MLGVMLLSTILLLYYFYRQHLVGRGEKSVIDLLAQQHRQDRMNLFWFWNMNRLSRLWKEVEKITRLK